MGEADPQGVGEALKEVLCVREEHADAVTEGDGVKEALLLPEAQIVPLTVPLTVLVQLAVEQADADTDTLALGVMVPDTVTQPLLLMDGELVDEALGKLDRLTVTLTVTLLVLHTVAVLHCDADCDTLELGDSSPDALAQPEDVADAQLLGDAERLPEAHCVPLPDPDMV